MFVPRICLQAFFGAQYSQLIEWITAALRLTGEKSIAKPAPKTSNMEIDVDISNNNTDKDNDSESKMKRKKNKDTFKQAEFINANSNDNSNDNLLVNVNNDLTKKNRNVDEIVDVNVDVPPAKKEKYYNNNV